MTTLRNVAETWREAVQEKKADVMVESVWHTLQVFGISFESNGLMVHRWWKQNFARDETTHFRCMKRVLVLALVCGALLSSPSVHRLWNLHPFIYSYLLCFFLNVFVFCLILLADSTNL